MDFQSIKLELLNTIMYGKVDKFLQNIADFVKKEKSDFWNKLSPAEQKNIKQGIEELNNWKRVSYDYLLDRIP